MCSSHRYLSVPIWVINLFKGEGNRSRGISDKAGGACRIRVCAFEVCMCVCDCVCVCNYIKWENTW